MPDGNASRTAQGVAFLRAVHQVLDASPLVLEDPVSLQLIGPEGERRIVEETARLQTLGMRALRAHLALRSRFAEDRLAAAAERGVAQFVILGAGFDTFAFRQPDWARSLRIIEVDQPASQTLKRDRLAEVGVAIPPNVTFASVDFERESLRDGLGRYNVSLGSPTFFSWLGVTMYLTESAVDSVLQTVAEYPPGSEIVFTFAQPPADVGNGPTGEGPSALAEAAAKVGEPWQSYFDVETLGRKLRSMGFSIVEFLTPAEAKRLYFPGRKDGLPAPRRTSIVTALV
jgi:methyltransferase (TIGR00027 family)